MDNLLYIAMSGAKENMNSLAVRSNNLANANTVGFKADLEQARAMQAYGEGLPSRVFAMTESPGQRMDYGDVMTTGRDLDVAVQGDGMLAVQGADGQEAYTRMQRFGAGLQARGLLRASESLASTEQAVRLQVRDGQTRLTDGPFAETKEMVGGFFLIDCATREEAVAIARDCPAAEWATVEVRELAPCYQ